jgi:16S rRNA (cytosine967-C5)-methyltransferase
VSAKPPAKSLKPGGAPARRGSSRTTGTREARGARGAAYDLLHSVAADNAYANLAMPGILEKARLSDRDAAFATELAYGTLRWRGLYDAILAQCVDGSIDRLDPRVLDVLRLGVHQLVSLGTPPHAAVGETVTLARQVVGDAPSRLVNAVLRRVAEGGDLPRWRDRVAPGYTTGDLAVAWSHPRWIVSALKEALATHPPDPAIANDVTADLIALLSADNDPARPTLVAKPGLFSPDELLQLPQVRPGRWSPLAGELMTGRPADLECVSGGLVGVQDEGSQLVALALANAPIEGPDRQWVDLAAGPGGKAAVLVGLAGLLGAHVTAVEPHAHRAQLVRDSLRRFPPADYSVVVADGRDALPPGSADRVLVDAPCTGLGALRRRPEARWRRTPDDLATLGPLQRDLLRSALTIVRPGGVVAYATCSPHLAETDHVIADVLAERDDVMQIDARAVLPEVSHLGNGPAVRLWTHVHQTDGMFLALMKRRDPTSRSEHIHR